MGQIGQNEGRENLDPAPEFIDFAEFSSPNSDFEPLGREI
jgi:hypothetical protein